MENLAILTVIHFRSVEHMAGRNRIKIISQILETANGGVTTKIKIMYRTNLSYAQLKGYLITLIDKNLLHHDLATNTFRTTEKGLRFLAIYNKLDDVLRTEARITNLDAKTEKV